MVFRLIRTLLRGIEDSPEKPDNPVSDFLQDDDATRGATYYTWRAPGRGTICW